MQTIFVKKIKNTIIIGDDLQASNLDYYTANKFLTQLQKGLKNGYKNFIVNFRNIQSFYPNGSAYLAGILDHYKNQDIEFLIECHSCAAMQISPSISIEGREQEIAKILNKVWRVNSSDDVHNYTNAVIKALSQEAKFKENFLQSLEWAINELMDNVIRHSGVGFGYAMTQIHKKNKKLAFCVFDAGIGIYNSLKNSPIAPKNPYIALEKSIQEGITRDKNIGQGNGMFGTNQIIQNNQSSLFIAANGASYFWNKGKINKPNKKMAVLSDELGTTTVDFQLDYSKDISLREILNLGGKKYQFINHRIENMENDEGVIEYKITAQGRGQATRVAGAALRTEVLNLIYSSGKTIQIDFDGVSVVSSSFIDEFIGKLLIEIGFASFGKLVTLKNMNETVESILNRSVVQRMIENFNQK